MLGAVVIKTIQKFGYLSAFFILATLLLWISVLWIQGLFGTYAWFSLKFIIPFVGIAGVGMNIVLLLIMFIKKKSISKRIVQLAVTGLLTLHILLTMNIIHLAYPNSITNTQPSVTLKWPLNEPTVVGWGGDTTETNLPHVIWPSERWAYDLVMEPYDTGSSNPEDYGIWDKEVFSPVSGTVIAAFDDEIDIVPGSEDVLSMEGNHVYIKIDETSTYILLNHLKKDSVTVAVGDIVNVGDLLGRVGNSGSTSEPHLHIHHQRQDPTKTTLPILAEGLPLYFNNTDSDEMPIKGTIVNSK